MSRFLFLAPAVVLLAYLAATPRCLAATYDVTTQTIYNLTGRNVFDIEIFTQDELVDVDLTTTGEFVIDPLWNDNDRANAARARKVTHCGGGKRLVLDDAAAGPLAPGGSIGPVKYTCTQGNLNDLQFPLYIAYTDSVHTIIGTSFDMSIPVPELPPSGGNPTHPDNCEIRMDPPCKAKRVKVLSPAGWGYTSGDGTFGNPIKLEGPGLAKGDEIKIEIYGDDPDNISYECTKHMTIWFSKGTHQYKDQSPVKPKLCMNESGAPQDRLTLASNFPIDTLMPNPPPPFTSVEGLGTNAVTLSGAVLDTAEVAGDPYGLIFAVPRGDIDYAIVNLIWGDVAAVRPASASQGAWLGYPEPNPSVQGIIVRFGWSGPGRGVLSVFDASGREVRRLADVPRGAGEGAASWDRTDANGARVPPGVYFLGLGGKGSTQVRRVVLIQ